MSHTLIIIVIAVLFVILVAFVVRRKRRAAKQHYPESEQLYVGNLSYQVNGYHLKEFFAEYASVDHVRLIKDNRTGRSKGFAFVTFSSVNDAKKALSANGVDLRGRAIVVRMAKPRD